MASRSNLLNFVIVEVTVKSNYNSSNLIRDHKYVYVCVIKTKFLKQLI